MSKAMVIERIKFGNEQGAWKGWSDHGDRCPDCGVMAGQYHKEHCDVEECPICHLQRLTCRCGEK